MKHARIVEELFAALPPKLVLDHCFEILSLIGWRAPLEFTDEKRMDLPEIRSSIQRNADELKTKNPYYSRLWLRSLDVAEEIVNVLIKIGLLVREGETFQRSEDFSKVYYMVKKMRSSAKRQVAWAIWYFHRKGTTYFDTGKILDVISYKDEHYLGELSDLSLWKANGERVKILSKSGKGWRVVEKPQSPSKNFLALNLISRLFAAVSGIADSKNVFSDQDIIRKIRELEVESMQETLNRLRVEKAKAGKCLLNDEALELVKSGLSDSLGACWPLLGETVFKNPHFKLENPVARVDVPNEWIMPFLNELESLSEERSNDLEKMREKALELKDTYNEEFKERFGRWLNFVIRKEWSAKKALGLQIRINWGNFYEFLDDFAKSDLPLEEKYEYLFLCRASLAWMKKAPMENQMKDSVKMLAKSEIREINCMIDQFIDALNILKDKMRRKFILRKHLFLLTLAYASEIVSTLEVIKSCVNNGTISTCYREMRKILESLSWAVLDDLLLFKRKEKESFFKFTPPFRVLSEKWYKWARQEDANLRKMGEHATLRNMDELSKLLKNSVEVIYLFGRRERYSWTKKKIKDALVSNLTYPLFLLFAGVKMQSPEKFEALVPLYNVKQLKPLATEDMENVLTTLRGMPLSQPDKRFAKKFVGDLANTVPEKIGAPYPSNEFVLSIVSKMLVLHLNSFYDKYSYFVHSYDKAWQLFPFSSVLEFKILRNELSIFLETISETIYSCLNRIP